MSPVIPPFTGFSKETFEFLKGLEENNSQDWFNSNRDIYDNFVAAPAKSFVVTIAPFFNQLNPAIRTEPKFNITLMRINNDMRFNKDKPYKNYFLIHFGRFKMDSEYFIYLDKNGIDYGIFLNNSVGDDLYFIKNLPGHKDELIDTVNRFDINKKFDFYEMVKEPVLVEKNFDIEENFSRFARTKHIILQKTIRKDEEIIYSPDLIPELIKLFSNLYPLYCYAISANPTALIEEFEENLGQVYNV